MTTLPSKPVLLALAVVSAVLVGAGVFVASEYGTTDQRTPGTLTAEWVSDTERNVTGNHHVAVGGEVGGQPFVFAPISGRAEGSGGHGHSHDHDHGSAASGCGLVALEGATGDARWTYEVSPENCTIHSVGDPTLADVDDDPAPELLVMYGDGRVAALSYDGPEEGE